MHSEIFFKVAFPLQTSIAVLHTSDIDTLNPDALSQQESYTDALTFSG